MPTLCSVRNKHGAVNLGSAGSASSSVQPSPSPGREGEREAVSRDAFRRRSSASPVASQQPGLPAAGKGVSQLLCPERKFLRSTKLRLGAFTGAVTSPYGCSIRMGWHK